MCLWKDYPHPDIGILLLISLAVSSVFPTITTMPLLCWLSCQSHHCCSLHWRAVCILQGCRSMWQGSPGLLKTPKSVPSSGNSGNCKHGWINGKQKCYLHGSKQKERKKSIQNCNCCWSLVQCQYCLDWCLAKSTGSSVWGSSRKGLRNTFLLWLCVALTALTWSPKLMVSGTGVWIGAQRRLSAQILLALSEGECEWAAAFYSLILVFCLHVFFIFGLFIWVISGGKLMNWLHLRQPFPLLELINLCSDVWKIQSSFLETVWFSLGALQIVTMSAGHFTRNRDVMI